MVDYIADYLENIRERRVFPDVKPGYMRELVPDSAPMDGEPWESIFKDVDRIIMPGVIISDGTGTNRAKSGTDRVLTNIPIFVKIWYSHMEMSMRLRIPVCPKSGTGKQTFILISMC